MSNKKPGKKKRKQSIQGTYALCITAGLVIGLGLGPAFGNVWMAAVAGGVIGAVAAYLLAQRQK
ncbi:MAG: hypothetical protein RL839_00370 [Gammaproteobacteria bacterium]